MNAPAGSLAGGPPIDLTDFDPSVPTVQQCPYDHYRAMRNEQPVLRVDGAKVGRPGTDVYLVSRHADVVAVLRDWETFSSRFGAPSADVTPELAARLREVNKDGWPNVSTMLTEDPPVHTRYRRLVSAAFTPRRVAQLEGPIRAICEDLVDGFARGERVDFINQFAVPLPIRAVAAILEVPDDEQAAFKRWADASVAAIGRAISDDERVDAQRAIVEQQQYFADQIERRRVEPRDDFLSDLLRAELLADDDTDGGPLSMAEMLSIIRQIQVAGSETTTSLLADMMVILARQPEHWRAAQRDPSLIPSLVEEGLRWASPNQGMFRVVNSDVEVSGTMIPKGATAWVMFGSANRDDRVFPDPNAFDPTRPELGRHVAFGKGLHVCLGAALARLEAKVALETLTARIDSFDLPSDQELTYGSSWMLRGLAGLDIVPKYR